MKTRRVAIFSDIQGQFKIICRIFDHLRQRNDKRYGVEKAREIYRENIFFELIILAFKTRRFRA